MPTSNTGVRLCSRCGERPRRVGQRWCQPCANKFKSDRYWRLKATEEARYEDVIPTPPQAERPLVLCYRCGYAAWHEHTPGTWVCGLCGIPPAS